MAEAAFAAYKAARAVLVDALQMEYFCDDVEPPALAWGWSEEELETFFKSGGAEQPAAVVAAAPAAAATAATALEAPELPDASLMQFLDEAGFAQLRDALSTITWDECEALYKEGRPKLLGKLGKLGVSLSDRQKFVTVFGKANKPAGAVKKGLPGGARAQAEPWQPPPIDVAGRTHEELQSDLKGYQAQIIRDGIPLRKFGLFPENDELLSLLAQTSSGCTKGLPYPTTDGGFEFNVVEDGWASGDSCCEHGMDLRWFINEGVEADYKERKLVAAVRWSEWACIGRGLTPNVHGGAIETALDEATAELAKSKLFPLATTGKIEFKISKPVVPNKTYRIGCVVTEELQKGAMYRVKGELTDATKEDEVYCTCVATMVNSHALEKQNKPVDAS